MWNRLRYIKTPDTGRRVSRLNPRHGVDHRDRCRSYASFLTICGRQPNAAKKQRGEYSLRHTSIVRARRPRYLFSGLTKCAVCGSGFVLKSRNRLSCFGAHDKGICSNRLTIRRDEVESRVLEALKEKLLRQDLFEEFCEEFTRETNRLRMAARAGLAAMEQEFGRVQTQITKLVQALKDGVPASVVKNELVALEAQQADLRAPP